MHHIKYIPAGCKCYLCNNVLPTENVCATYVGDDLVLVCNVCEKEVNEHEFQAQKKSFDDFIGDPGAMQVAQAKILEAKEELAYSKHIITETVFMFDYWDNAINELSSRIKKLKNTLLFLSPNARGKVPEYNYKVEDAHQIKITDLMNNLGFKGNKQGRLTTYSCPFHSDSTPSFTVYADQNRAHCYSCGFHGDNIAIIMKVKELSFKEALKFLCENFYS